MESLFITNRINVLLIMNKVHISKSCFLLEQFLIPERISSDLNVVLSPPLTDRFSDCFCNVEGFLFEKLFLAKQCVWGEHGLLHDAVLVRYASIEWS